jgi:hypothetical protein
VASPAHAVAICGAIGSSLALGAAAAWRAIQDDDRAAPA